jgi:hypothetical protein
MPNKDSWIKPQQKASNTSKMPSCHLAREIKGLQQAAHEQVSRENESALHKGRKLLAISVCVQQHSTRSRAQRALEESGNSPASAREEKCLVSPK